MIAHICVRSMDGSIPSCLLVFFISRCRGKKSIRSWGHLRSQRFSLAEQGRYLSFSPDTIHSLPTPGKKPILVLPWVRKTAPQKARLSYPFSCCQTMEEGACFERNWLFSFPFPTLTHFFPPGLSPVVLNGVAGAIGCNRICVSH